MEDGKNNEEPITKKKLKNEQRQGAYQIKRKHSSKTKLWSCDKKNLNENKE